MIEIENAKFIKCVGRVNDIENTLREWFQDDDICCEGIIDGESNKLLICNKGNNKDCIEIKGTPYLMKLDNKLFVVEQKSEDDDNINLFISKEDIYAQLVRFKENK